MLLLEFVKSPCMKQGHEKQKVMKNEKTKAKASKKVNHDQSGMSAFIRKLFADGVKKVEAYGRTLKKYPIAKSRHHFEDRWAAAQRLVKSRRVAAVLAKSKQAASEKPAQVGAVAGRKVSASLVPPPRLSYLACSPVAA
jgi:hypothetical protein